MTTVNYNDGNWHGWNGGECPVHPETVVQVTYTTGMDGIHVESKFVDWSDGVIAFRVIKEYKEPERTWSRCVDGATYRNVEVKFIDGVLHVREVTP